jgi:hypothetical protein
MKRCLVAIPLIAGAMFFSGCVDGNPGVASGGSGWPGGSGWSGRSGGSGGSGDSGVSGGIDPITQAGIDAGNAATQEQSNQETRDAAAQANAASANQ